MLTRRHALGLCLAGLITPAALRTASAAIALSPEQLSAVLQAELYLNDIKTLHSRFIQTSSNGSFAEGEFFVSRPGRLRFEYTPPHPVLLIADGFNLLYYDKELKQSTFIPLWETPLWFLIRENVNLSGEVEINDVTIDEGVVSMTVQEREASSAGQVTLVFTQDPFVLRRWEVTDGQGIRTKVSLIEPTFGLEIEPKVFEYDDLDVHGIGVGGKNR